MLSDAIRSRSAMKSHPDLDQFRGLSTSSLSDALDMLRLEGAIRSVHLALSMPLDLIVGPAYTVQFGWPQSDTPAQAADYIDDVPVGSVVVLANNGRMDCTVWGGILSHYARRLGLAATLIDGCCRDLGAIRACGYPVFSRGVYMQSGKGRAHMVGKQVTVQIAGTTICPGDIVCGDENGIIVLPASRVEEILQIARHVEEAENHILAHLSSGGKLVEARSRFDYNRLGLGSAQSKKLL